MPARTLALMVLTLSLVACAPPIGDRSPDAAPTGGTPDEPSTRRAPQLTVVPLEPTPTMGTDLTAPPTVPVPKGTEPLVDQAVADLARLMSIDPQEVRVVGFESVVWPDAGLGCPQPGVLYAQVQVEGYAIRLQVHGHQYAYHGGEGRGPFLCENSAADG